MTIIRESGKRVRVSWIRTDRGEYTRVEEHIIAWDLSGSRSEPIIINPAEELGEVVLQMYGTDKHGVELERLRQELKLDSLDTKDGPFDIQKEVRQLLLDREHNPQPSSDQLVDAIEVYRFLDEVKSREPGHFEHWLYRDGPRGNGSLFYVVERDPETGALIRIMDRAQRLQVVR
jgi:hypothetical protein